jgi:hypothetical protein
VSKPFSLIVTDTSPLHTLVLAGSLDVLLRPGLPVAISDSVSAEATQVHGVPSAEQIVEWINEHLETVRITLTDSRRTLREIVYSYNVTHETILKLVA